MQLERLEARRLLAGDVTASFDSGILTVNGDDFRNEIQVDNVEGEVRLIGNSTNINGAAMVIYNDVRELNIDMGGGRDSVLAQGLAIHTDHLAVVTVNGGNGNDQISLSGTSVVSANPDAPANLSIVGDINNGSNNVSGNDTISLTNTVVHTNHSHTEPIVSISGERNDNSVVNAGHDRIFVRGFDLFSNDTGTSTPLNGVIVDSPLLQIHGETNLRNNVVQGGNDMIVLSDVQVDATGGFTGSNGSIYVAGDWSDSGNQIFGGNDRIFVEHAEWTATGGIVGADAGGRGDRGVLSVVGNYQGVNNSTMGSNDQLHLNSISMTANGGEYNRSLLSVLGHVHENLLGEEHGNSVQGGNDRIQMQGIDLSTLGDFTTETGVLHVLGEFNGDFTNQVGGNDVVDLHGLSMDITQSSPGGNLARPFYIGGDYNGTGNEVQGGNDKIALSNSSFQLQGIMNRSLVIGELSADNNSVIGGNDWIELDGLQFVADEVASFSIIGGSWGAGSNANGDNDSIAVYDVQIGNGLQERATSFSLDGDILAEGSQLIGGNDRIRVEGLNLISADNLVPGGQSNATVFLTGDSGTGLLDGGNDDIFVSDTHLQTGNAFSAAFAVFQISTDNSNLKPGGGNNLVRLDNVTATSGAAQFLSIANVGVLAATNGASGADRIYLDNVHSSASPAAMFGGAVINIRTGLGNDRVSLSSVTTDELMVDLGEGDDWLSLDGVFADLIELDGGLGYDILMAKNTSPLNHTNFESV